MLTKRLNQRGGDRTLILVNDWKNDTFAAAARLSCRGDDHYHHDRDDQQRYEPVVVAAYEPEVLKHHRQRLQALFLPPGLPYLLRISQTAKTPESLRILREPLRPSSGETNFQG